MLSHRRRRIITYQHNYYHHHFGQARDEGNKTTAPTCSSTLRAAENKCKGKHVTSVRTTGISLFRILCGVKTSSTLFLLRQNNKTCLFFLFPFYLLRYHYIRSRGWRNKKRKTGTTSRIFQVANSTTKVLQKSNSPNDNRLTR